MSHFPDIRRLAAGDEMAAEAFLARHAAGSMFMRSNLARARLGDDGQPYQGRYFGAFRNGELAGVAAYFWNGNLMLQAPRDAAALAEAVLRSCGDKPLKGVLGPWEQVNDACASLCLRRNLARMDSREILYELPLSALELPQPLIQGQVTCRRSHAADLPRLLEWRRAYSIEVMREPDTPERRELDHAYLKTAHAQRDLFVLEVNGGTVATSAFNARLPDTVQIGGVFTPPASRGRGYARAVVAGSLLAARREGAKTGILFTGEDNPAAQLAYAGLGFQPVGDYGLVLFEQDPRHFAAPRATRVPSRARPGR